MKKVWPFLLAVIVLLAWAYAEPGGAPCIDEVRIERCAGSTSPVHEFQCSGDREVFRIANCGGVLRPFTEKFQYVGKGR